MTLFFVLIIAIGWFVSFYYDDPSILFFAVIFSIVMNIVSYWFSDKIVLKITGAKPASKEEYYDLYTIVENLSITAGLPTPKIFVVEDNVPNAFATGRNKEHAVVAVTSGLLNILEKNELEGVIAHELSHIGNRDILLQTVVVVLVGFISLLSDFFLRSTFNGGNKRSREGGNSGGLLIVIGVVFMILSPLIATVIQLAISRKREFLADATGVSLTRYPEGLASALEKISQYSGKMKKANHATAHLFLADPFGSKEKKVGFLTKLFLTHPPVEERIKALRGD
ncbi:M48 family metallopeptidase [Candidatus Nomurabacteria bacterium]|nr:M48 family metallopeptidase [Candidatus Nomurabacteria bacterium]